MSVLDRFGKVVKSEWNHRFGRSADDDKDGRKDKAHDTGEGKEPRAATPARKPRVADVEGALRVLELSASSGQSVTLDEVRARYRELARRYHPKTGSANADEAHAAQVVLEALTDALELLEEHLLPLAEGPAR